MAELYKAECGDVAHYNPSKGLETIAVAEIGEKYWARAKDPQKLYEAIEAKITAQAEYVVWRDSVVVPSQESGRTGTRKTGFSTETRFACGRSGQADYPPLAQEAVQQGQWQDCR
jgi:hypothetical protein